MKPYVKVLLNNTSTPEETFFQIMSMRSPFSEYVEANPPSMITQNCKTLAYFSDKGKPFKGHPYIISKNEIKMLKQSGCFFARKFDETVDDIIFDMIDTEIINHEN